MNAVNLAGRPTGDPSCTTYSYRDSDGNEKEEKRAAFTLAVSVTKGRKYEEATYVRCIAFRNQAQIVMDNVLKGKKIIVEGHLKSGKYQDKDGISRYTLDLIIDDIEFCEKRAETREELSEENKDSDFMKVSEMPENELPLPY